MIECVQLNRAQTFHSAMVKFKENGRYSAYVAISTNANLLKNLNSGTNQHRSNGTLFD